MPKRIPVNTVVIARPDPANPGKKVRVSPPVGEPFNFTTKEIEELNKLMPGSLTRIVAEVDDEDDDLEVATDSGQVDTQVEAQDEGHENVVPKPAAKPAKKGKGDEDEI